MKNTDSTPIAPRMLPAIIIVAAHMAVSGWTVRFSSTNIQAVVGLAFVPVLATICLVVWWLRTGNIPRGDRARGLAILVAALALPTALQLGYAMFFLIIALPVFTTGAIVALLVSAPMKWSARRWIPIGLFAALTVLFTGLRVDALGGDLVPIVSWRWSPAPVTSDLWAQYEPDPQSNRAAAFPGAPGPGDWLEFRGPSRDGALAGVLFDTDWEANPPEELWRIDVGLGWSSFTVVGDYFFTQEQRGAHEVIVCYETATGGQVWAKGIETLFEDPMGSGPRATPTYVDGKLYCQGATGTLQCLDASTGETLWQRDIGKDTGAPHPEWGFSSSPLVIGDLVVEYTGAGKGKSVIAYDRFTGEIAWNAGEGVRAYNSAHMAEIDGVPQLLMGSDVGVQSIDPESGEILWESVWSSSPIPSVLQPLVINERSIVIGYGIGTRLINARLDSGTWKVEEQWTTKKFRPYFNDFVHHEGYLYGFDGNRFACVDAATGDRVWKGGRIGGQVLLLSDMGVLLVLTEKGKIVLLEATPNERREIASIQAIRGKTWNHPVIANGILFVRNDHEAAAYRLAVQ